MVWKVGVGVWLVVEFSALTRGAFAVYQQLTKDEKSDAARIKGALMTAFVIDKFTVYKQFKARVLCPSETVDVYLVDLQKFSILFGGMPDSMMVWMFVWGLPVPVKRFLRSSARMDNMFFEELLTRAIMIDEVAEKKTVVAAVQPPWDHSISSRYWSTHHVLCMQWSQSSYEGLCKEAESNSYMLLSV